MGSGAKKPLNALISTACTEKKLKDISVEAVAISASVGEFGAKKPLISRIEEDYTEGRKH